MFNTLKSKPFLIDKKKYYSSMNSMFLEEPPPPPSNNNPNPNPNPNKKIILGFFLLYCYYFFQKI
jgi:hypothetical protein